VKDQLFKMSDTSKSRYSTWDAKTAYNWMQLAAMPQSNDVITCAYSGEACKIEMSFLLSEGSKR